MYLDTIRNEMTAAISMLKDGEYRRHLTNEIEIQRKLKIKMSLQAAELDKEVYTHLSPYTFLPSIIILRFID